MFVKKLHSNVFDVFLGNGFTHWTRVRRGHWGVSVIAGARLPKSLLREVQHKIG